MRCGIADIDKVARVLMDDDVIQLTSDDLMKIEKGTVKAECANMLQNPAVFIFMPDEDTVFIFNPLNNVMYDVHIAIKKGESRKKAVENLIKVSKWMVIHTNLKKAITMIPEYSEKTLKLADALGMKREGKLSSAYLKNGKLHDIIVYGITNIEFIKKIGG